MSKKYYTVLGIATHATQKEVEVAFRAMAIKHHPDRSKAKDADAKMKEINEAYSVLGNVEKRANYDSESSGSFGGEYGGYSPGERQNFRNFDDSSSIFKDIFNSFFGSNSGGHASHGSHSGYAETHDESPYIPNISVPVKITFNDWYSGTKVAVKFNKKVECSTCSKKNITCKTCKGKGTLKSMLGHFVCQQCGGSGACLTIELCNLCNKKGYRIEVAKYDITLPSFHKGKMVFDNYGDFSPAHQKYGSLVIDIVIEKHNIFSVEDLNIVCNVTIGLDEFIAGTRIHFLYLDNKEISVVVPALSCSSITVPKKGIVHQHKRGGLVIRISVMNNSVLLKESSLSVLKCSNIYNTTSYFKR